MPPVRSIKNQYRGINAHLHSYWQSEGGWDSFHNNHITYLAAALKGKLLPMGYTADTQQSLQIRRLDEPAGKPESDVTIYDTNKARVFQPQVSGAHAGEALAIADVMSIDEEISPYDAISIYEFVPGKRDRGEPIAWIELLSPSNKPGGQDAAYYRTKRYRLLQSGIVFIELDYLHESSSTFDKMARYPIDMAAGPYRIMVIDPRPEYTEGVAYPFGFAVDDPIPTVDIPLNAGDILRFDFDAPYQRTLEELFFAFELVDYSTLPLHFERYRRDDQMHILARMMAVLKAAKNGLNLEEGAPFPIDDISLDDGLSQLNTWGNI